MRRLTAISAAIAMAFGASTLALAGDDNFAQTYQNGNGNTATVDQTSADNANRLLQFGMPQGGILPGWLGNHDTIHQVGNGNTATVTEAANGSADITAQVNQQGNGNIATISTSGTGVWGYITTVGNNSTATISQVSGNNAAGYIAQGFKTNTSNGNVATITQVETNGEWNNNNYAALPGGGGGFIWNDTNIAQDGALNQAIIYQQGSSNSSADIIQIGSGNTGSISQYSVAHNSLASIEQYGTGNYASSSASGDADSSILQRGADNFAFTTQLYTVGNPNVAAIVQTGTANLASVTQQGGGNRATVRQ